MTTYIALKTFKYDGKTLNPGDEFIPADGRWDHILIDPEKKYVRIEKDKKKAVKKVSKEKVYVCDYCQREFDTPQGKAAHQRFCKQKE